MNAQTIRDVAFKGMGVFQKYSIREGSKQKTVDATAGISTVHLVASLIDHQAVWVLK